MSQNGYGGRIFRTTRQSAALGRSACKLIGTWFQVPFSRGCWHRDKMSRHTVFTVKTQLRGCLLYVTGFLGRLATLLADPCAGAVASSLLSPGRRLSDRLRPKIKLTLVWPDRQSVQTAHCSLPCNERGWLRRTRQACTTKLSHWVRSPCPALTSKVSGPELGCPESVAPGSSSRQLGPEVWSPLPLPLAVSRGSAWSSWALVAECAGLFGLGADPGKVSDPGLAGFAGASAASGASSDARGRIFRTTRQSAALGRSACKLIGTWFQVPFSRGCWHRDKMSRHTVFTVKTQLRGCLLYAAKACAEWGPHP